MACMVWKIAAAYRCAEEAIGSDKKNGAAAYLVYYITNTPYPQDSKENRLAFNIYKANDCRVIAEKNLEKQAEKDPIAALVLGLAHETGKLQAFKGGQSKAVTYYTMAAEGGCPYAAMKAAIQYLTNSSLSNPDKGVELLERLVNEKDIAATRVLKQCYNDNVSFLKTDPNKSFELCKKLAEWGEGLEMAELGEHYLSGKGTTKDETVAKEWYLKSKEKLTGENRQFVENRLKDFDADGHFYLNISDFTDSQAREVYKKALNGDGSAQYTVAQNYQKGLGGATYDEKKATSWLNKAIKSGNQDAIKAKDSFAKDGQQYREQAAQRQQEARTEGALQAFKNSGNPYNYWCVGQAYEEGKLYTGSDIIKVKINLDSAAVWYEKTAEAYLKQKEYLKFFDEGGALFRVLRNSNKSEKLIAALNKYISLTADAPREKARLLSMLAYTYYKGIGGVKTDYVKAAKYCKEALAVYENNYTASALLGLMMYFGKGMPVNKAGAYSPLWKAFSADFSFQNSVFGEEVLEPLFNNKDMVPDRGEARLALGTCFEKGLGVTPNVDYACTLWALARQSAEAQYKLGQYTEKGRYRPVVVFGVKRPNLDLARELYRNAADLGYAPARAALKRLGN